MLKVSFTETDMRPGENISCYTFDDRLVLVVIGVGIGLVKPPVQLGLVYDVYEL